MKNRFIHLTMLFLCMFCTVGHSQTTITVSPSKTFQTIEGIGGGIVYYLDWLTTHKNKEILYDTIFNGLGISALRMGNWAHEPDADLSYDAEIYQAAKERLGNKFFTVMSSWSAPVDLKANNKLSGTNGGYITATLKKEYNNFVYDKFGQWWKRAIEQYHNVGVYPTYISMQNEPDCDADYEATVFSPTNYASIAHYGTALNSVYKYVSTIENGPQIIGPEALGIGWNKVQEFINNLDKRQLSGYCFHYYHSGMNDHDARDMRYSYPDDFLGSMTQLSKDYLNDKPMYMTENSSLRDRQELDPIYMATFLSYAFSVNHVVSYLHWNLIWGDEGDGCINLDFDERGYKSEDGYTIQGDYHALRHYSKFIQKGWVNIDAQTTNKDVIVSAFQSPDKKSYTLVIVNRSNYAQYIKLPFFPEGTEATVIRSVPKEKTWSKVVGTYNSLGDIYPPANSITTIAYRPLPTRHTFRTEESDFWGNTLNWHPTSIPQASDTVVIRKGVANVSSLTHNAPIFIEKEGTLCFTSSSSATDIRLNGGIFNVEMDSEVEQLTIDSSSVLKLDATLKVEHASFLGVSMKQGSYSSSDLPGVIEGNGILIVRQPSPELTKESDGELDQVITLGESIVPLSFKALNADSIVSCWNPSLPDGLSVLTSDLTLSISGVPVEEGIFHFTVSTLSDSYKEAETSGSITITKGAPVDLPAPLLKKHIDLSAHYADGSVNIMLINDREPEIAHFLIADMTGKIWMDEAAIMQTGNNDLVRGLTLPAGCYLLQKRGKNGMKTIQFTVAD